MLSSVPLIRFPGGHVPRSASVAPARSTSARRRPAATPGRIFLLLTTLLIGGAATATPVAAVGEPVMDASVMLQGHARVGSWMAIRVHLRNDGPSVVGELRLGAGAQGRTRFGTPVDLPTKSDKDFVLYAQPPAFGRSLDVALVDATHTIVTKSVAFTVHDAGQLVVGVIAEQPQRIVPDLDLLPGPNGAQAAIVPLGVADLPDRVEAWSAIDRLVWQDVDSQLTNRQLAALRGWLAAGGRLVVAAGTNGPSVLSGFPDDILPYRPTATVDVPPESVTGLIGQLPNGAKDLPALGGTLTRGRALATSGDRVIAAEAPYGSGVVTILGFDPTTSWITDAKSTKSLWRRFLPPRSGSSVVSGDDGQMVNAVAQLPALALPPIGGLLGLLFGYILLIGPINYLVLRRLDRREWAWITMPVLIAVFAIGSYAFGAALRGLDVILNEVAIVRGAPDATEGTAQVYLGVFSPSRGTYQVDVPGGALLSSTLSGELGGSDATRLDVLQGDPSRIRDLTVGFGSLRTVRAETAAVVPRIQADLSLVDGTLKGTIRNLSDQKLEKPAVVLGSSVVVLKDLDPNAEQTLSLPIRPNQFGDSLSDRILGQTFFVDPTRSTDSTQRDLVRHAVLDQLTFDPNSRMSLQLPSDSPVLLAWGDRQVLDVRISGQIPRRTGNVLYYIPLPMKVHGSTAFEGDLVRSSVVSVDAAFFNKDPMAFNIGKGSITVAYRPIAFDGALSVRRVVLSLGFGGDLSVGSRDVKTVDPVSPQPCRDEPADLPNCSKPPPAPSCDPNSQDCSKFFDGLPEVEVLDRTGAGTWMRLPHLSNSSAYELRNPDRYVDPASGTLELRFVSNRQEGVGFTVQVRIEGDVK